MRWLGLGSLPHDPLATDPANALQAAELARPCGTDQVGRDICTRIIYATRLDLFIAMSAVAFALVVGSLIGSLAGFFGGWVDRIAMWAVDTIMAFPLFLLAMGIVAALGSSVENIIYATAIVNVPFYARTVRAEINQRREAGFVEAARVSGNGPFRILAYHLFPTTVPQLAVQMTLTMGWAMLNAAALSFIGLGHPAADTRMGHHGGGGRELHHHRRMVGRTVSRAGARCLWSCRSTFWATACAT